MTNQVPKVSFAVIGGSGLYSMPGLTDISEHAITTPFGDPSDVVVIGTLNNTRVAFLPRHGRGHRLTPSEVPYRANIAALKTLGVTHIVSVSACGSLQAELKPRDIVVPDQLLDFTKGFRKASFFGEGVVGHVSFANPFSSALSKALVRALLSSGGVTHDGGTFVTIEGPRFSSKAESNLFRAWGCDIVGMTCSPEAMLAREAEIDFAVMAHVTDYDCWHDEEEPVTVQMVIERLHANLALAQKCIAEIAPMIATLPHESAGASQFAVMTAATAIPASARDRLSCIMGAYLT